MAFSSITFLIWFLPLSVIPRGRGLLTPGYEAWFIRLMKKLLDADRATLRLFRSDPFAGRAPRFVRARFYRYRYTSWSERKETGAWWKRTVLGEYLPPVSTQDLADARG